MKRLSKSWLFRFVPIVVAATCFGFGEAKRKPSSAPVDALRIYYGSNRQGEVEPCGCQTGQLGGLNRLQKFFSNQKAPNRNTTFLEVGDAFYSSGVLPISRLPQEQARAELIARAYKRFGLEVYTPGIRDLAAGLEGLKKLQDISGANFVISNLLPTSKTAFIKSFHIIERNNFKIGVMGLVNPEDFSQVRGFAVRSPKTVLAKQAKELRAKGVDRIVLLSYLGLEKDRELAKTGLVDLVFGSKSLDVLTNPVKVSKSFIFQTDIEGKQIGVLDFVPKGQGLVAHSLIDLDESLEEKNAVYEQMQVYLEKVRSLAFNKKEKATSTAKHPFVAHPTSCRTCHEKQFTFWEGTKHASAYMVLFSKNQHFNPECIGCHSLGFGSSKGFSRIAYPIELTEDPKLKKGEVFVEKMMNAVFGEEKKKGPLDSRKQVERHKKLHKRYTNAINKFEEAGKLKKVYIGVQCEHCHGNRAGHPSPQVKTLKKVNSASCLSCHKPAHDPTFNFKKDVALIACPKR